MSVASKNPFDLLGAEDVESEPTPSTKPKKDQSSTTEAPSTRGSQRGRGGPASRGGRYYQRGGSKPAPRDQPAEAEESTRDSKRNNEEGGRGRGRGRGRGDRARGGGRGRPFDRHSATGKTDSDKKIHQGWGGDEGKSELKAEEDGSKDAFAESPKPTGDDNAWGAPANDGDGWGAPPADFGTPAQEDTPAETRRGKEEEEDNTLTLDQYLAQQKEKASDVVPKLENVRQANDGAENLFKDAIQVVKGGDEDSYFAGKPKASKQRTKQKEEKVTIEIDGRFNDPPRSGGRGGRGGDRSRGGGDRGDRTRGGRGGRGGRGRGRGDYYGANGNGNGNGNAPDLSESAFPSLS